MKKNISLLLCLFILGQCYSQTNPEQLVVYDDVHRFWHAYDLIHATKDTTFHKEILEREFLHPGTDGLKAIMEKKGYSIQEYLGAIRRYPSFWESIRANTFRAQEFAIAINQEIDNLKTWYPELKTAHVYFTIGVLRSGGTAHDGNVLIGSELALADSNAVTSDIQPDWLRENHEIYFKSNPIGDIVLLSAHEYVHTQQNNYGYNLFSQCIYEGVAEFVSVLSHGGKSASPAIVFGERNMKLIQNRFEKEIFSPNWNDWLYNNDQNEFGIRDLGYYVGYAICQSYFNQAMDKLKAIRTMIELDYKNQSEMESFLMASGYLSKSIKDIRTDYLKNKPTVLGIVEFENGSQSVDSSIKTITIKFSAKMSDRFRNQRFGPLGQENVVPYTSLQWGKDLKSITFEVELESNKRYQIEISNEYRTEDGIPIDSYLIDFNTKNM